MTIKIRRHSFIYVFLLLLLFMATARLFPMIITEFSIKGSAGPENAPWVEIYNNRNMAINLKGWGLTDLTGTDSPFINEDAVLNPGEFALIHFKALNPDGSVKTAVDSENEIKGKGFNGYWDFYSGDTAPSLSYDFEFLVLTSTPGSIDQSLSGAADAACIYSRKGDVSSANIERLNKVLQLKLWGLISPGFPSSIDTALTNYNPVTDTLPLVYIDNDEIGGRYSKNRAFTDTDTTRDWLNIPAIKASPGHFPERTKDINFEISKKRFFPMEGENTGIAFFLQADSAYSVKIYDLSGRLVNTLVSQKKSTGKVQVVWDGRGRNNEILKTGIYLIKLTVVSPYSGECRNLIKAVVLGTRL